MQTATIDEQPILDCAVQIQSQYNQLEADLMLLSSLDSPTDHPLLLHFSGRFAELQQLFDSLAALIRNLPELSKDVQDIKAQTSVCYGKFQSLQSAFFEMLNSIEENLEPPEDEITPEEEELEESEDPPEEEPDADDPLPEGEPEEPEDDKSRKRKKKGKKGAIDSSREAEQYRQRQQEAYREQLRQQEEAERQRQEARRAAASTIYGRSSNPDQPWSEADIRMAEHRRAEDLRLKEQRDAENRRFEQESREAYQKRQQQSREFERPSGHIDMSFSAQRSGKEPESPSHQSENPQTNSTPSPDPQSPRKERPDKDLSQEIAAALGISVAALHRMSSSELRFWENRLRISNADSTGFHRPSGSPPASASSQIPVDPVSDKKRYEARLEAAAQLGIPVAEIMRMTDHQIQAARSDRRSDRSRYTRSTASPPPRPEGSSSSGTQKDEAHTGPKRYHLRRITDSLIIAGVTVGEVVYDMGKSAALSSVRNYGNKIVSTNDALTGISTGSYYMGTAAAVTRSVIQHNPTAPLKRSASRLVGQNYEATLHSNHARQQFATFQHEKKLDAKMVSMLRKENGKMPTSSKELQVRSQQIQKEFRGQWAKKVSSTQMQRSHKSLTSEISSLKGQGAATKNRVKQLTAKGALSPAERKELIKLQGDLKRIGKEVAGLTNTVRAKQDLTYVSRRLQNVTKTAFRNKQAIRSGAILVRGFLMRPLAAGYESNTEGLYYAHRIISDPLTRTTARTGYRAARWTLRLPLRLAHKVAPKTYEAASATVTGAAHAVAAAPKKLAKTTLDAAAQGISNLIPKGVKTGIQRVRSTYATAKTGIQNAVYRANAWLADTAAGHAATSMRIFGRKVSSTLRAIGTAVKGFASKALLVCLIFLLIFGALSSFIPSIVVAPTSSVILSPAESTSGKINLGPYCMVYASESRRFDQQIVALLRKYGDKEIYDDVQINYSGVSSNAREILSMMAVHLHQSLDIDTNPDVKSYISYMFRESHVYSVYEHEYYCEGCELRPVTNPIPPDPPGTPPSTAPTEPPQMEPYCPGHIDVTINVNVYAFDELFNLDGYPSSNDWEGWTETNRDWCKTIYNMDWLELYEGLEYLSSGGSMSGVPVSAHEQKIWNFLMDLIGNEYGAAGLMGNLYCESGLDPTELQDTYEPILGYNNDSYTAAVDSGTYSESSFVHDAAGYGLAQWTWHTRKQALYSYCKSRGLSISDIDGQLGYLGTELRGSFSRCLSALQNASSVEEASRIAMLQFEAPADQSASAQAVRRQYAEYFYNKMVFGTAAEGDLTEKQREVIHIAMNSASYGIAARPGYCQAWAAYVYAAAGLPIDTSASAYDSGIRYGVSSDFSAVPPGAAVYGYSGSKYGHVGIYVGNNQVYHNVGGVAIDTLSDWISKYRGFCWGWEAGSDLTTYD